MLTKKYNGGFMKGERQNDISELLAFAGSRKVLTFIGLILSGISMLFSMVPYICIWLTARSLIEVAPHWREAVDITRYGWTAFIFAFVHAPCRIQDRIEYPQTRGSSCNGCTTRIFRLKCLRTHQRTP